MTAFEKIRRLTEGHNRSLLSRAAGLKSYAIDSFCNTGRMPSADRGIKIARVLNVPAEWLFDDSQDWPPPPARSADADAVLDLIARAARAIANTIDHEKGQRIAADVATT